MDDRIRELLDKEEVAAAVNELFVATDEREWDRVRIWKGVCRTGAAQEPQSRCHQIFDGSGTARRTGSAPRRASSVATSS